MAASDAAGIAEGRVCVGIIVGPHGIRGQVRVKSFTAEPEDVASYGPLIDEATGRAVVLDVVGRSKGVVLCALDGVEDRTAAEALRGMRLMVDRAVLPETEDEDEFYHADLIGLRVEFTDGTVLGTIAAVYDFGAGDMLEVRGEGGGALLVPFTREAVPVIDITGGRVVAERLPGLVEEPPKPPKPTRSALKTKSGSGGGAKGGAGKSGSDPAPGDDWPEEDWREP